MCIRDRPLKFPQPPPPPPPPPVTMASLLDNEVPSGGNIAALPPSSLPSTQVASTVPFVPSLFSSIHQTSATSHSQLPTGNCQLNTSSSLVTMNSNSTTPAANMSSASLATSLPASCSFTTISSVPPSQPLVSIPSTVTTLSAVTPKPPSLGFHPTSTAAVGNFSLPPLPAQLSGQTPNSLATSTSLSSTHGFVSQGPTTSATMQPQGQQLSLGLGNVAAASTTASTTSSGSQSTATSPVGGTNPNPLVQLVQLYKQCQSQGDNQGMMKIKQQLNIFVARQKIIAAQNSLRAASGLNLSQPPTNLPTTVMNTSATAQSMSTRLSQSQNASSSVALGQTSLATQPARTAQQQTGSLSFNTAPLSMRPSDPKPQQVQVTMAPVPSTLPVSRTMSGMTALSSLPQVNTAVAAPSAPSGIPAMSSAATSQPPFSVPPPVPKVPSATPPQPPPQTNRGPELGKLVSYLYCK